MPRTTEGSRAARAWLAAAAALAALAAGPGCVSKPAVTVHHAEVRAASLEGVGMAVYLEIDNANAYDVEIRAVHAEVTIAGKYKLAPLDIQPKRWLKSNQTTLVAVPVWIPWSIVPALVVETAGSTEVRYHVVGTADVTATRALGIQKNDYPVSEDGAIPRQKLLDAAKSVLPF